MSIVIKCYAAQKGVSLIEAMVGLLIFSVGILGVASMQSLGLKTSSNSLNMSVAVTQASNMADIVLSNPQALANGDFDAVNGDVADISCSDCTASQKAQQDIYDWQQRLIIDLPSGAGTIGVNGTTGLYTIAVSWNERGEDADQEKFHTITFLPYQP